MNKCKVFRVDSGGKSHVSRCCNIRMCMARSVHKIISTQYLIMEVDFCPVLCIPEVPVLQAFGVIRHFVWYCKAVSDLS